ncbi:major facilitator superfamily domain-containing protein [Aspergillus minisclerotigenes]|uniref:Major facilitator superfamily domain-containing protein n=1 Tax=Aspergillus minisclerotigenes TaxID=656917 RepID=A0A5N6INI5_9EURO|nr:major facilitator superfamily domain-containing protein [Aspergillus minisclerotigenes]
MWFSAAAYFAILSGLYSFGLFLPTIIDESGFATDPNAVQLWTVVPYAVAAALTVFVAFLSDRLKLRGPIMLFTLPIAIAGYGAIANIQSAKVKYGMTFLMATGMYSSVPCILVWNTNNSAGHYKRATTSAMQLTIANCGGFVATFNYPDKDKPQYHRGHTIILGLLVFAWFMVLLNILYCAKVNRDKKKGRYAAYVGYNDDRDPAFKLML